MSIHLIRDLDRLHQNVVGMCTRVEEMVHAAVDGLHVQRGSGRPRNLWQIRRIPNSAAKIQGISECGNFGSSAASPCCANGRRIGGTLS